MKQSYLFSLKNILIVAVCCCFTTIGTAQETPESETPTEETKKPKVKKEKSEFWKKTRIGGGLGMNFSNGSYIALSPTLLHQVTDKFSAGIGFIGSWNTRNDPSVGIDKQRSNLVGGTLTAMVEPMNGLAIVADFDQLNVTRKTEFKDNSRPDIEDSFWNPALYLGAGFKMGPTVIGFRYDVLFNGNGDQIYENAFTPFVRAYF